MTSSLPVLLLLLLFFAPYCMIRGLREGEEEEEDRFGRNECEQQVCGKVNPHLYVAFMRPDFHPIPLNFSDIRDPVSRLYFCLKFEVALKIPDGWDYHRVKASDTNNCKEPNAEAGEFWTTKECVSTDRDSRFCMPGKEGSSFGFCLKSGNGDCPVDMYQIFYDDLISSGRLAFSAVALLTAFVGVVL